MLAIIKKEIKSYFLSPVGYVFIGLFMLISSILFYVYIWLQGTLEYSYLFYYTSELLTFTTALLTMGMFAGERKNGTDVLLLTTSKSITGTVLGKFLAAFAVIVVTEILSLVYYVILCIFAGGITEVAQTATVLLGFLLLSLAYISFGGFISSLTESPIIAGIITIVLLLASWFIPNIAPVLIFLSPIDMFQSFPDGVISIVDTVCLLSHILLFTLLTITVLQRKKIRK